MSISKTIEPTKYRFKKHASLGASDAEADQKFLAECFIDSGDIEQLLDLNSSKRIIVGRTGAGKSALIHQMSVRAENCIALDLESLTLSYVSNSDIIRFFEDLGVNLDIFYTLLWRHVFTVELLKKRFNLDKEEQQRSFFDRLSELLNRDKKKEQAVNYLKTWGEHFWQETEYRVKEFTQNLEQALTEKAGINISGLGAGFTATDKISETRKAEIIHKAQKVVNEVQIKDLAKVIDLLADDFFADTKRPFYITIDKLDENWATDSIRYKLIRALLETIRTFQRIPSVKIIASLRVDLLERVFEKTRNLGFQEEKYESLYLPIRWSESELRNLLDKRITYLLKEQYTKKDVTTEDIFPNKVNGENALEYMCSRSFFRPRDIILFANACITLCEGKSAVPASIIKEAEAEYSRGRLRSLADEWHADYPNLSACTQIFTSRPSTFKFSEITQEDAEKFVIDGCTNFSQECDIGRHGLDMIDGKKSLNSFLISLLKMFYRVGLIGIKPDSFNETQWAFKEKAAISDGQLKRSATIKIHPMFWRALGIQPPSRSSGRG